MKVWRGDPLGWGPGPDRGSALTIGVFDGVHRGHQALLAALADRADRAGRLQKVVVTFDVHPRRFFDPAGGPALLLPLSRRLELLAETGLDQVGVLPFADVRHLGPEEFIGRVVVEGFNARSVVVGEGFRYGAGRAGDVAALADSGRRHGFSVTAAPLQHAEAGPVSSSAIRRHVAAGEVTAAADLLSRPHEVTGRVVRHEQAGRKPTLLLEADASTAVPAPGDYTVRARTDDHGMGGVCSIGAAGGQIRVHLPDHPGGLGPGERLVVSFLERLPPETAPAAQGG